MCVQKTLHNPSQTQSISSQGLAKGVYVVQLKAGNAVFSKKGTIAIIANHYQSVKNLHLVKKDGGFFYGPKSSFTTTISLSKTAIKKR